MNGTHDYGHKTQQSYDATMRQERSSECTKINRVGREEEGEELDVVDVTRFEHIKNVEKHI